MTDTVSVLSILFMTVALLVSAALPVGLCLYFRRKKGADLLPFFTGCAVMLLFAFALEPTAHRLILGSKAGPAIVGNIWLYALYGGAMAGLFEETGRLFAFLTILRDKRDRNINALMYGAGHGGMETIAVLGITSINNILLSALINSGSTSVLTGPLSGETLQQVEDALRLLVTTPSWQFLLGSVERILAVALHLCLSVLVWFASKNRKRWYLFPAAILIHLVVDAGAVVLSELSGSVWITEVYVAAAVGIAILIARKVWKDNAAAEALPEEPAKPQPEPQG